VGYLAMAALVLIGIATTLLAAEPEKSAAAAANHAAHADENPLARVMRAAGSAFSEFLSRDMAIVVLLFVILYKLCDAFAGKMMVPFVLKLGFSLADYAAIGKAVGIAALLIGGFVGGAMARALPMVTMMWIGLALQAISNLAFTWLAFVGLNYWALATAIIVENFTGAIGTVIFVAYLSSLCQSPLHTATQFALLTALAGFARTYLSAGAGYVAEWSGWPLFFVISTLVAAPSFVLLAWMQARGHFETIGKPTIISADD
jgi:PAT family beta-lactamase induction signal transducer AmpG